MVSIKRAYILIEIAPGKIENIYASMQNFTFIKTVDIVAGPYDLIAMGEAEDVRTISALVTEHIDLMPGVLNATTCIAVS